MQDHAPSDRKALRDRAVALADCNNFFASCERRVDPSLNGRPVVVLSCNDGCVVARSNEVKALGIKMGEPYFKIKDKLAYYGVAVRSSNLALYQRISASVMARLRLCTDIIEQYSIDESFFNMAIYSVEDPVSYCAKIRADILDKCGIPVSIGIAPTKTLAKLSAEYAKHNAETGGVFWMDKAKYCDMDFMRQFACEDIWGIGGRSAMKLARLKVATAADFISLDEVRLKRGFGINALFTQWELRGHPAYDILADRRRQKSIMVSRSFGSALHSCEELLDPLLCFTVAAAIQLRRARKSAGRLTIFIMTSRFAEKKYFNSREVVFNVPKFLDRDLIAAAKEALSAIYVAGYDYKKCGVMLTDLGDTASGIQTDIFGAGGEADDKQAAAARAIDKINRELGSIKVKPAVLAAAPGTEKKWKPRSDFHSQKPDGTDGDTGNVRFQSHAEDCW